MIEEARGNRTSLDSQSETPTLEHNSIEAEERSVDRLISSYDTNLIRRETARRLRIANEMEVDENLISLIDETSLDEIKSTESNSLDKRIHREEASSFEQLFQRALHVLDFTPVDWQRSEDETELSFLFDRRLTQMSGGESKVDSNEDEEILLMEDEFLLEQDSLTITTHFDILDERVEVWFLENWNEENEDL